MAILEVTQLKKSFGGNEILKGIDFSLERGSVLSLIGSSGSGKTTLLRCLNLLETPDSGTIRVGEEIIFDGTRPYTKNDADLRKKRLHFGLVFQNFNLFPQYTALENVTLALKLHATERADYRKNKAVYHEEILARGEALLTQVGLKEKMGLYPHQLSGGQQQRVAIARALALNPDILCFDEPTSALDPELSGEVLKTIRALADQHMTMIIVTHEMGFAREVSGEVLFMDDGHILERGTPQCIFDKPETDRLRSFLSAVKPV